MSTGTCKRIAHVTVPREFIVTDDLPRTPTGTLVKQRLRDRCAEGEVA